MRIGIHRSHPLKTLISISFVVILSVSFAQPLQERAPLPKSRWPIVVVGHRAGAGIAPENTLAAIRQAIDLKVDYVEIDVRTTKYGALVIMHDGTVDRMTDGHGQIRDLTLDETSRLNVKNRFGDKFPPQRVPTFEDVLKACRGKVNIYLDDKDTDPAFALAVLKRHRMERNVVVYNGPDGVKAWKRADPKIPVMPSLPNQYRKPGGVAQFEAECPAEVLDGHFREWTKELVEQAHAAHAKVWVDIMGATDNPEGYAKAIDMGVDGIQTDYPDRLIAYLKERFHL